MNPLFWFVVGAFVGAGLTVGLILLLGMAIEYGEEQGRRARP